MIRQNQRLLNIINAVLDGCLIVLAYMLAVVLYLGVYRNDSRNLAWSVLKSNIGVAIIGAFFLVVCYRYARLYGSFRFHSFWDEVATILRVNLLGVVFIAAILYLFRLVDFSRGVLASYYVLTTVLVVLKRFLVRSALRHFRKLGYNQKHVIVVGNGILAHRYVESIKENRHFGFLVDGYLAITEKEGLGKKLGRYEDLLKILNRRQIDEVVVALEPHENEFMRPVIDACEQAGVRVSIIPFYNDYIPSRPTVDVIGEVKLFNIRTTPLDNLLNATIKRTFDILGSIILIILSSPVMAFVALGVKLSSPGPVFFVQERIGRDKKPFKMLKFRSMRINAGENTAWSTNEDPRKTKFGSFIRKFSLDELPQFFNVLFGQMSLIGPRPEIPFHVDHFKNEIPLYLVRQQVRPGITGWAQVNGFRGDTSIKKRVEYDIWYIENWSLGLDIRILFKTIFGGIINNEVIQ